MKLSIYALITSKGWEGAMQSIQEQMIVNLILRHEKEIFVLDGLKGFEQEKHYTLIANAKEMPLIWLQSKSYPDQAFVCVDPYIVYPTYQPELPEQDLEKLLVENADDLLILCLTHVNHQMTINLVAPLLINWNKGTAKQIIINNHNQYSLRHPLFNP